MDNIIFDRVIIKNFLSIGNSEIDLSERGFVLVKGENRESERTQSNGSGKSAIFDSIFWTLTGETLRGTSDVINESGREEGCTCTLDFHSTTTTYRITRTRGDKTYGNSCLFYINDELVSDQLKKSQEMIEKAVPSVSSPETLGSIIILGQGLPHKFSSLTPSKRKSMLETMSGSTSQIDEISEKLDKELESHSSRSRDLHNEITRNEGEISGLESTVGTIKSVVENYSEESLNERLSHLQNSVSQGRREVQEYDVAIAKTNGSVDTLTEDLNRLRSRVNTYLSSESMMRGQLRSMDTGDCPTCGRPFDVTDETLERKALLENKLLSFKDKIESLDEDLKLIESKISSERSRLSTLTVSRTTALNKINSDLKEISDLEKDIKDFDEMSSRVKSSEDRITELRVSNSRHKESVNEEREYVDCINYLKRQLSRDFKGYILEEVIGFLSSRSEYYSSRLFTNGRVVEVSLSGNRILITIGDRAYENLSGGERQRTDLAVQFALRDLLVVTSGFSCNLLVLDEAFDNLDDQGASSLVDLIVSEFTDVDSVFIVTHHSDIDVPYDTQITVTKESDGISYTR